MPGTLPIPSAILFDLDDTILTCEEGDYRKLWRKVIDEHIDNFEQITTAEFYQQLRTISDEFWSDQDRHREGRRDIRATRAMLVLEAAGRLGQHDKDAAIRLAHDYHHRRENAVVPFDGAMETLEFIRSTNIRTALLTNGAADIQRNKIDRFNLAEYFDLVLVEGELEVGKPDPKIYRYALEQLEVSESATWMVGDNLEWEVRIPQQLGITAIWHDFRREGLPIGSDVKPDLVVGRIRELVELLV